MVNTINVPLSCFTRNAKTLKTKKKKVTKHKYHPTFIVKKVPYLLRNTNTIHITSKPLRPVGGNPFLGRGLFGVIQSHRIASDGTILVRIVEASEVAAWICCGKNEMGDLVVLHSKGLYPAHVPDLSDLALLPPALKMSVRWALLKEGGVKGASAQHLVPSSVKNIIYPTSGLPDVMESFSIASEGVHVMEVNSYSDDLKNIVTEGHVSLNNIFVASSWLGGHLLDGRRATLQFTATRTKTTSKAKLVTWNCRDMGRESFMEQLEHVIELQLPDIILLTKTRVSIHMARFICKHINWTSMHDLSSKGVVGWYALMVLSNKVNVSADSDSRKWRVIEM